MPVIPATWEEEIRRITGWGQLKQKKKKKLVSKTPSQPTNWEW
jgi:hypothetical protein